MAGAALVAALLTWTGCGDAPGDAVERGDRLMAAGDLEGAVAEYRLAVRQGNDAPAVVLRLAHAYAESGDLDRSLRYWDSLVAGDSARRALMAAELVAAARRFLADGERDKASRAVAPLLDRGLGLVPADLRAALAHHHFEASDYARALALYLSVLPDSGAVAPELHLHTARSYEELGGCGPALPHFRRYLQEVGGEDATGARWHYGNCLFSAAREDREAGRPQAALEKLDRLVALGVPQSLLDRAHFERGELLMALGDREAALSAFEEVLRLNPARSGRLVQRAEERIRDIRFGYQ